MNTKEKAIASLQAFMTGPERVLLLSGTHQHEKHPLALGAALALAPAGARILFRANSKQNAGMFLQPMGIGKVPAPGTFVRANNRELYVDTINRVSWRSTPSPIHTAIVYPLDSLGRDDGDDCVQDLMRRQAAKIMLVTWTDNKDFSWVDGLSPVRIVYDAEAERPDYHERMREIESEGTSVSRPKNLPGYAQSAPRDRLIKIHCRGCNTGSWALLNKPHPGATTIRQAPHGEYRAKCLKCGRDNDDNYNW